MKSSDWKSLVLVPLLLLCLLLFVNSCTSKKLFLESRDPIAEIEELQQKEEEKRKKEQEGKEEKSGQQEESEQQGKQQKKKKRKKFPATQRPYVIEGQTYSPISSAEGYQEIGLASWYGDPFHGRKTANGETYDMYGVTAAHKTLPMNTMLLVKNLANGKTTTVRVNDRGPFVDGRIIDLSYTTAKKLGIVQHGTEKVQLIALCATNEQDTDAELIADSGEEHSEEENQKKPKEEKEEKGSVPVLAGQSKKQMSRKKTKESPLVAGTMCAVILPNGTKKRIRQDFDKGNFYIQVASFEEKKKARKLARTFAGKGRNVIIQEFAAAGTSLFRVQVFSSTSLKEAKKHKETLSKQGFEHAFVIARDAPPKKSKKIAQKGSKGLADKIAVNK